MTEMTSVGADMEVVPNKVETNSIVLLDQKEIENEQCHCHNAS